MALLEIEDLSFKYPLSSDFALSDINITVEHGELVLLCGHSGCGKTTLLKLLKRQISPVGEASGEIFFDGSPLSELDTRRAVSEVGYVTQDPDAQIVTDTVWHELAFGLECLGVDPKTIKRRVSEICGFFGITDWYEKKTCELSGGQKQLLLLASVTVTDPKVLLLDEPTAQLDPIAASAFFSMLQKINRELGITVIIVEHRLEEIFPIADKVIVMDKSRVCLFDIPQKVSAMISSLGIGNAMYLGLPASVRLYNALNVGGECPLTVSEGRRYILNHFDNKVQPYSQVSSNTVNSPAVELKNVSFRFDRNSKDVLADFELDVYSGEILGVLGGNGVGKSTLLRLLCGIVKPYSGKIKFFGKNIEKYSKGELCPKTVAMLSQNPTVMFTGETVERDLLESALLFGYSEEKAREKINTLSQELGFSYVLGSHPFDLSGGEVQKAAIAKLLLADPKILLLDEPTKGLDPLSKKHLAQILLRLKESQKTVILVTHDIEFAAEYTDRCTMLFNGQAVSTDITGKFFCENTFYTTAISRMTRNYFKNTYLCEQAVLACRANKKSHE